MNPEAIKTLFDYHFGMWDRVWDCVMELTDEQFVQESDYSWRSVRNHLVHAMSTDNRWLARIQNKSLPDRFEPMAFATQDIVRESWNIIRDEVLAYTNSLSQSDLQEMITINLAHRDGEYRNLRWEILSHVVNHGTDHRAQILARLHELGAMTVEQDMILYLWSQQND